MKWTAVAGSRKVTPEVIDKVRAETRKRLEAGGGIVTGGAPGVDFAAADEAMKFDPAGSRLIIITPTKMDKYRPYLYKRISGGHVTFQEFGLLTNQIDELRRKQPGNLVELDYDRVDSESFHARNSAMVDRADEVLAFQVNRSNGTQNTIDKGHAKRIPVDVHTFEIEALRDHRPHYRGHRPEGSGGPPRR